MKSFKIWGKLAQEQKSYRQKNKLGVEHSPPPPVLIGLKISSQDPISIQLTLKIFVCVMEIVGVHTIQFLHPNISFKKYFFTQLHIMRDYNDRRSLDKIWAQERRLFLQKGVIFLSFSSVIMIFFSPIGLISFIDPPHQKIANAWCWKLPK